MNDKQIIGRNDKADFPEFGLIDIAVKTDTGAYTSSIHVSYVEEIAHEGDTRLAFTILDDSHPDFREKIFKTRTYTKRTIKNSFGQSEERYVITTLITLFGKEYPIELSLSERGNMKYPVLLGRRLLNKCFLVDTDRSNLSFRSKKTNKNN